MKSKQIQAFARAGQCNVLKQFSGLSVDFVSSAVQTMNIIFLIWFCSKLSTYYMYVGVLQLLFTIICGWYHDIFYHNLFTLYQSIGWGNKMWLVLL